MAHTESQRLLLTLTVQHGLQLRQADVVSAFLNGEIDSEFFMDQPDGFRSETHPHYYCKLRKGLYGLKQAGFIWNRKLNSFLTESLGFISSQSDPYFYYMFHSPGKVILLSLNVDDMIFAHNDSTMVERILGKLKKVLGIRIRLDEISKTIIIDQETYISELLS